MITRPNSHLVTGRPETDTQAGYTGVASSARAMAAILGRPGVGPAEPPPLVPRVAQVLLVEELLEMGARADQASVRVTGRSGPGPGPRPRPGFAAPWLHYCVRSLPLPLLLLRRSSLLPSLPPLSSPPYPSSPRSPPPPPIPPFFQQ